MCVCKFDFCFISFYFLFFILQHLSDKKTMRLSILSIFLSSFNYFSSPLSYPMLLYSWVTNTDKFIHLFHFFSNSSHDLNFSGET